MRPVVGLGAVLVAQRRARAVPGLADAEPDLVADLGEDVVGGGSRGDRGGGDRVDQVVRVTSKPVRQVLARSRRPAGSRASRLAVVGAAHGDSSSARTRARGDARAGRARRARRSARARRASIAAAAAAGLAEAEVGAFARAEPVLPEAILERIGVEAHAPAWPGTRAARAGPAAAAGGRNRRRRQRRHAPAPASDRRPKASHGRRSDASRHREPCDGPPRSPRQRPSAQSAPLTDRRPAPRSLECAPWPTDTATSSSTSRPSPTASCATRPSCRRAGRVERPFPPLYACRPIVLGVMWLDADLAVQAHRHHRRGARTRPA